MGSKENRKSRTIGSALQVFASAATIVGVGLAMVTFFSTMRSEKPGEIHKDIESPETAAVPVRQLDLSVLKWGDSQQYVLAQLSDLGVPRRQTDTSLGFHFDEGGPRMDLELKFKDDGLFQYVVNAHQWEIKTHVGSLGGKIDYLQFGGDCSFSADLLFEHDGAAMFTPTGELNCYSSYSFYHPILIRRVAAPDVSARFIDLSDINRRILLWGLQRTVEKAEGLEPVDAVDTALSMYYREIPFLEDVYCRVRWPFRDRDENAVQEHTYLHPENFEEDLYLYEDQPPPAIMDIFATEPYELTVSRPTAYTYGSEADPPDALHLLEGLAYCADYDHLKPYYRLLSQGETVSDLLKIRAEMIRTGLWEGSFPDWVWATGLKDNPYPRD